ncbi:myosin phosphatase Rho-interacting protein isoform X2 [Denticeps clupeoides]|uniref:myosin phosphatase Rho-interacting protein isoform X2 n=1 Tax=Denticeps clupeoides TaxID=299321 RepID=UPI0010A497F2|nr:myosin phosphatase Rho-interacting protein isoform X2 [Denticeps clupeoides]
MSAKENPCRKFQANIFNKSKCQNCFKPRELHLLTDQDLNQAKPIYGGWLCLAPEGTDFDNPMQRSRKWQRRFFVLYEHGCLRFALDESPSTLPQGTVNMNLCTDVIDAEPRTGQKNALCIITPDQEYYIRGENKEIINGWNEQLVVYPRTNKQNQKKKRKVEPATSQEPGPAKVAVTGSGIPDAEQVPDSSSIIWQEELQNREADVGQPWVATDMAPLCSPPLSAAGEGSSLSQMSDQGSVNGDEVGRGAFPSSVPVHGPLSPTGSWSSRQGAAELGGVPRCPSPVPSDPFPSGSSLLSNGSHISGSMSSLDSDASGSTVTSSDSHLTDQAGLRGHRALDTPRLRRLEAEARKAEKRSRALSPETQRPEPLLSPERSERANVIEKLQALELENAEQMDVEEAAPSGARQGRSQIRRPHREDQKQCGGQTACFQHHALPPLRRAKSLDRRTTESVMTPDLLNFKKGWMVKLDEEGQWKKYWFVLTDHSLRYYKDSIAEEASDLDGEIDLSNCYNVTEYQAQRNYGFQIHTQEGVHTLSAMTAGIRRNWIQAVMKNVRPSTAPDVASLADDLAPSGPLEGLIRPDVTQDSQSSEEREVGPKRSRARERRRDGRSKTFDWAEFRPIAQALAQQRASQADSLQAELGDAERNRRREERRRRRYESLSGTSVDAPAEATGMDCEGGTAVGPSGTLTERCSPSLKQKVEEEIEQQWQQVEKTPIRQERRVPLSTGTQSRDMVELENLLETYKRGVEELKTQLDSCHMHLEDSNQRKLHLEQDLRAALEREQQVRAGYISPLDPHLGLEAELESQMKRTELVSSQAQTLTRKYQETKELLHLQEVKRRNMQAQLGLSLTHPPEHQQPAVAENHPPDFVQKPIVLLLQDRESRIEEVEQMICGKTLTLQGLMDHLRLHSEFSQGQVSGSQDCSGELSSFQKLLLSLRHQHEVESETMRRSLARAGDSIRSYEARLVTMEDMLGRVHKQALADGKSPYGPMCHVESCNENANKGLSQRVELLTSENEALNQRYQEILNQLREADREIDRLKSEAADGEWQPVRRLQMDVSSFEQGFYERELSLKSQKLEEALANLEVLGNSLKETEKQLNLKTATLKGLGFQTVDCESGSNELHMETEEVHHRLKLAEAKLSENEEMLEIARSKLCEKEEQLQSVEGLCRELQAQNLALQLKTQEPLPRRLGVEDQMHDLEVKSDRKEGDVDMYQEEEEEASEASVIDKVIEELRMKSEAMTAVVEMLKANGDLNALGRMETLFEGPQMKQMFFTEGEFWSRLVSDAGSGQVGQEGTQAYVIVTDVVEGMLLEKILLMTRPSSHQHVETETPDLEDPRQEVGTDSSLIMNNLLQTIQEKIFNLNQVVSTLKSSFNDQVHGLVLKFSSSARSKTQLSDYVREAVLEAHSLYLTCRQRFIPERPAELLQPGGSAVGHQDQDVVSERDPGQQNPSFSAENQAALTCIQIEGEPIDSLDKAIQLQDMVAQHRRELHKVKEAYEQEMQNLRLEVSKAEETLRMRSEENVKEIDSLTVCMENLKQKHEKERRLLEESFHHEMEDLRRVIGPGHSAGGSLKEQIQELVSRVSCMSEEMRRHDREGDAALLRLKYEKDLENLKATCERGFAAMEESHQKVVDELQRKHQRELEDLKQEKDRLLAEETAATIAAIEAMKNAHRTELERELEKARKANSSSENADIEEIRKQHEEELLSYQREIEVLSEQYSQKCLENAHLAQALEAERQALRQCQRENQELNAHNQELNNRLAAEITKMRSMSMDEGDGGSVIQGKELYELEVMLRVKESEVQYLKQEINSLKDELQAAQRDKKYATDKYKDIYTELSIVRAKAERDLGRLREQLQMAHEALGEPTPDDGDRSGYDIMKSKSNPDILKMAAAAKRSERTMRSKEKA